MSVIPQIKFVSLENCAESSGLVVAVDVCRAFTTAAYAFDAGAERILLVSTVEEALHLRAQTPGSLIMGEVGGLPVAQFDLWNSPAQFERLDVRGKTLIQRTSAGTQGIVRALHAQSLFAVSFAVAGATVRAIRRRAPQEVTFVITGLRKDNPVHGLEDVACAEYMTALLQEKTAHAADFMSWVEQLADQRLEDVSDQLRKQFLADLAFCASADRFCFAMPVRRSGSLLIMEKEG